MVDVTEGIYDVGTVSIENGSDQLIGTGTFWLATGERYDEVYVAGQRVLVKSIDADGAATLALPWDQPDVVDSPYVWSFRSQLRIDPTMTQAKIRDLITFYKMGGVRGTRELTSAAGEIVVDDLNKALIFNRSGGIAVSIAEAGANGQFVDGWATTLKNAGSGLVTITPDEGAINGQPYLELPAGAGAFLWASAGNYFALVFSNLDGADGGSIFVQPAAPGTGYAPGSIWIDSDSATLDLYSLTGDPLAWADTGLDLRGLPGADGIDGASALTVVRVVATANVNIASALENGDTLNGVVLATGDLVLLPGQTSAAENGVYVVAASGAAARHSDFNTFDGHCGRYFSVMEGTSKADTLWRCTSNKGGTLGATAIVMSEFTSGGRERLVANRIYYVRADLGAATVTIATPGVWTLNAHGLSNDDPVVVSIKPDTTAATISAANPAVVTMTNTFAAGQPIKFFSTGYLPAGVIAGTVYYVLASGLSGASFQFSTAPGGAAVNTTAISSSFTNGSTTVTAGAAHNLKVGQLVRFAGSVATNFSAGVDYFVLSVPTSTTFTVSATNGGSAISAGSTVSGGTVVQTGTHYVNKSGTLPTGLAEGTTYYARGVTLNTFELAAAPGGASIATSGTQSGTFNISTGNDNNNGLAATRAGAFLTVQKAIDAVATLDIGTNTVTAQLADSLYLAGAVASGPWLGSGNVQIFGNAALPGNVIINPTGGVCFTAQNSSTLSVAYCEMRGNVGVFAKTNGIISVVGAVRFGPTNAYQVYATGNGSVTFEANYTITGGALAHVIAEFGGIITGTSKTVTIVGVPAFTTFAQSTRSGSYIGYYLNTFLGSATGQRFNAASGSFIDVNLAGVSYLPGDAAGLGTNYGTSPYGLYQ